MVKFVGRKVSSYGIEAWAPEDRERMERIPYLKEVQVTVSVPRSVPQLRLWWGMVRRIANAVGVKDVEALSDLLLIEAGYCDTFKSKKHGVLHRAKSIAFGSIEQAEFNEIFNRCVDVLYSEWGIARKDVLKEVNDLLYPGMEDGRRNTKA